VLLLDERLRLRAQRMAWRIWAGAYLFYQN
jgi:hypothetical protein